MMNKSTPYAYKYIIDELQEHGAERESRAGDMREIIPMEVMSLQPRSRLLIRPKFNLPFALQECFAYWNGQNPGHVQRYNTQMKEYMYDGELHGSAYGRYLRGTRIDGLHDQIDRVIDQLTETPDTRRAVATIHNPMIEDYDGPDVACTMSLHFLLREGELDLLTTMRSQDMLWGYPYDTFAFQFIQELVTGLIGVDLGAYVHRMNSCHYYTAYEDRVTQSVEQTQHHTMPDIRLDEDELSTVMMVLDNGLMFARNGRIPNYHILRLETYGDYWGDWLRLMTAYEQLRFHDDRDKAADLTDQINIKPFYNWMISRMNP